MKRFVVPVLVGLSVLAAGGEAAAHVAADQPEKKNAARLAEVYTRVDAPRVVIPPGEARTSQAMCPPGQVPTGGGYNGIHEGDINLMVRTNSPTGNGWFAVARNTSATTPIEFWAIAICAPGTQVRPQ
ncbi:hypothetical protein ACFWZT_14805 [Streptomyces alboflavus]|uniref:hypothetical protein n=1 Tax=Streptomyces alboflavus TaxID=67267 RepID=UPI003680ACC4